MQRMAEDTGHNSRTPRRAIRNRGMRRGAFLQVTGTTVECRGVSGNFWVHNIRQSTTRANGCSAGVTLGVRGTAGCLTYQGPVHTAPGPGTPASTPSARVCALSHRHPPPPPPVQPLLVPLWTPQRPLAPPSWRPRVARSAVLSGGVGAQGRCAVRRPYHIRGTPEDLQCPPPPRPQRPFHGGST